MIRSALKARFLLTRTAKLLRNWHAGGIESTLFFARWLISVLTSCLISPSLADHIDFLPEILEPPRAPIQSPHTLNVRMRVDRRRGEAAMAARHAWSGMFSRESKEGQVDDGGTARMERDVLPQIGDRRRRGRAAVAALPTRCGAGIQPHRCPRVAGTMRHRDPAARRRPPPPKRERPDGREAPPGRRTRGWDAGARPACRAGPAWAGRRSPAF